MSIEEIVKELTELAELYDTRDKEGDGNICMKAIEAIRQLKARAEKAEAERDAAIKDLYDACKYSPCNTGICVNKNCKGNVIPCDFKWRGEVENKSGK